MALADVSNGNNTLEQLVELRIILARAIDTCESSRDLAALSRRYMEVVEAIDAIDRGLDVEDEVAAIIIRNRKPAAD